MRTAIESYLACEEQYEQEKIEDMQRWEQFELSGHAIDHTAAEAWLKKLASGQSEPWQE